MKNFEDYFAKVAFHSKVFLHEVRIGSLFFVVQYFLHYSKFENTSLVPKGVIFLEVGEFHVARTVQFVAVGFLLVADLKPL